MTDKKDLELIREAFDRDGLRAPDSLSEDKIRAMLESAPGQGNPAAEAAAEDAE